MKVLRIPEAQVERSILIKKNGVFIFSVDTSEDFRMSLRNTAFEFLEFIKY